MKSECALSCSQEPATLKYSVLHIFLLQMCATRSSHLVLLDLIKTRVQIMKPLIMQFPPVSRYAISLEVQALSCT
jgi:hypothetical protein